MKNVHESAARGFVSSFEEEEYEVAKFLNMSNGPEDDDDDDEEEEEEEELLGDSEIPDIPDNEKEILDDDEDLYIKDYF